MTLTPASANNFFTEQTASAVMAWGFRKTNAMFVPTWMGALRKLRGLRKPGILVGAATAVRTCLTAALRRPSPELVEAAELMLASEVRLLCLLAPWNLLASSMMQAETAP
mmetsp:Transcript_32359/g.75120  ORF Transcript_32359/g.75120 Transcript_32359/m.75120 type:complete len:110 (-) Transcript_32359:183-512(-)